MVEDTPNEDEALYTSGYVAVDRLGGNLTLESASEQMTNIPAINWDKYNEEDDDNS
jgi:hypothetical protein